MIWIHFERQFQNRFKDVRRWILTIDCKQLILFGKLTTIMNYKQHKSHVGVKGLLILLNHNKEIKQTWPGLIRVLQEGDFIHHFPLHLHSPFLSTDLRISRPLILPGYPENTTAVVGGQAKLVCKVHRPASTRVQWLKKEAGLPGRSQGGQPRLRALTVRAEMQLTQTNIAAIYRLFSPHHTKTEMSPRRRPYRATPPRQTLSICPTSPWRMQGSTSAWLKTPTEDRRCRPCSQRGWRSYPVRDALIITASFWALLR